MKLLGAFNPSYPFPKPWFTRMLWFKLKPWFEQNQYFCVQTFFYTRAVLHKNCIIHKHNVLHKNHVLAGPVQGLFAAYKIALSMVAGGTRQRLLNIAWMGVIHYIPMKSLLDCRFTPFWTPSFPCGILGGASHWINELYPQVYVYIYIQIHTYIYIPTYIWDEIWVICGIKNHGSDPWNAHPSNHSPISAPRIHSPPMSAATEQVFPTWMCTPQQFVAGQAWLPTDQRRLLGAFLSPKSMLKSGKAGNYEVNIFELSSWKHVPNLFWVTIANSLHLNIIIYT